MHTSDRTFYDFLTGREVAPLLQIGTSVYDRTARMLVHILDRASDADATIYLTSEGSWRFDWELEDLSNSTLH